MGIRSVQTGNRPYWLQFIFAGQAFTVFDRFTITAAADIYLLSFRTPVGLPTNSVVHFIGILQNFVGGGPVLIELIENPDAITNGTQIFPQNMNRRSSKTANTLWYTNSTGLTIGSGVVIAESLVASASGPNAFGTSAEFRFENVLKEDTNYVIRLNNSGTQDADFHIDVNFYESFN